MPLNVIQVVNAISQATHDKHHGGGYELKRDEIEKYARNMEVMDGFGVTIHGNTMLIRYASEEPIQAMHDKRFGYKLEQRVNDIRKTIEKKFADITGAKLRLKEIGELTSLVETTNRVKIKVKAQMAYEILNLKDRVDSNGNNSEAAAEKINSFEVTSNKLLKMATGSKKSDRARK